MPLPLDGVTAFILGTGPSLPANRLASLYRYFTIGVNHLWKQAHTFRPTVGFWIDGGVYDENPEWFDSTQCVCDQSALPRRDLDGRGFIALRGVGGPLPKRPSPKSLYLRPNTGVVAAIWAVSLGCEPVVLLGMDGEDDGRRPDQLSAMRNAVGELLAAYPAVWRWPRCVRDDAAVWSECIQSNRLNPCNNARGTLRDYYQEELR